MISSDDCGGADPILGVLREVILSVRRSDVAIADDLLDALEASNSDGQADDDRLPGLATRSGVEVD